jgi:tetratricopeptide (TPR) repeat protein
VADQPDNPAGDADALFASGEEFVDAEQYADAVGRFQAAWEALPDPKEEQDQAVQILAAVADCHFYLGQWEACHNAMQHALRCGAELDNSFVRLRLGQSLYELGDEQEAANWLVPVYLMEGRAPFAEDDPKYLEFFRSRLHPPEGGWPDGW